MKHIKLFEEQNESSGEISLDKKTLRFLLQFCGYDFSITNNGISSALEGFYEVVNDFERFEISFDEYIEYCMGDDNYQEVDTSMRERGDLDYLTAFIDRNFMVSAAIAKAEENYNVEFYKTCDLYINAGISSESHIDILDNDDCRNFIKRYLKSESSIFNMDGLRALSVYCIIESLESFMELGNYINDNNIFKKDPGFKKVLLDILEFNDFDVDTNDWAENLRKASKHDDIIDL